MPLIAVEGCTITCSASTFQITSQASQGVTIDGKGVYREKLSVLVPTGASQGGGTLVDPVSIDINPQVIAGTKADDKKPLAVGDTATANGNFQVGQSVTTLPIVVTITDAGQQAINVT